MAESETGRENEREYWLRGPVAGIAPLLQPVAHALLQARDDVARAIAPLSGDHLWEKRGGAASVGFHVKHLAGSLDRLLTYARGEALSDEQMTYLKTEAAPGQPPDGAAALTAIVTRAIESALDQVRRTPEHTLLEPRQVGRKALPTTVLGLLFHAAEHTSRHAGQVITTAKIVAGE